MQCRKFLTSTVAATAFGAPANSLKAERQATEHAEKPFVVKAGETRFGQRTPFRIVNANDLKLSSKDTNGAVSVFEYVGKEKTGGLRSTYIINRMKSFM